MITSDNAAQYVRWESMSKMTAEMYWNLLGGGEEKFEISVAHAALLGSINPKGLVAKTYQLEAVKSGIQV